MKPSYSTFVYLLIAICFVSLSVALFALTYPLPLAVNSEHPEVVPLLLFYCCVAYFHTMQFFRSAHPKLIQYQIMRLTAFALLVPVVVLLSMAHNWFTETSTPDYFRVPTLALCYICLSVAFKAIFKRYYTA